MAILALARHLEQPDTYLLFPSETHPNIGNLRHKLIVLDDETAIGGSFKSTGPANEYNDDNLFLVGNLQVAEFFKAEMKRVFESDTLSADF